MTILAVILASVLDVYARPNAKYIFYFVGDGLGINHIVATDLYNQQARGIKYPTLSFLSFPVCTHVNTSSANRTVTDSAAAATALACGVKTNNAMVGMLSDGTTPVENVMETARKRGLATGFVTSVAVNHATPSGFICHAGSRGDYMRLSRQLIDSGTDFLAGYTFLVGKKDTLDARHWEEEASRAGMTVTRSTDEAAASSARVLLLCPDNGTSAMTYAIERRPDEPSVADYTSAAIRYLTRNFERNGFLLAVEGGRIDYANHDNDGATMVHEINELDRAIAMAVEFQKSHPRETLIILASDHETGGLGVGRSLIGVHTEYLQYQNLSEERLSNELKRLRIEKEGKITWEEMKKILADRTGLWTKVPVDDSDTRYLKDFFESNYLKGGESIRNLYSFNERLAAEAIRILNKTSIILWTCRNHTASPTPLYVSGAGHEFFFACRDNTDIPKAMRKAMGAKAGTR